MFERFTNEARQVVAQAQAEARQLQHRWVGTEHLLLALLARQESASAAVLARHGLSRQAAVETITFLLGDDLDAEALRSLGIELDAIRDRVEEAFGPGALDDPRGAPCDEPPTGRIPFSPRAKKVLEFSLREALALKDRSITDPHIALGLLREGEGVAATVLRYRGIDTAALRRDLTAALRS